MQQRITPEINAGSMADIAFLLLIFFLVTTTIDVEKGLTVKLPILPDKPVPNIIINKRNTLNILINDKDELLVNNQVVAKEDLREIAFMFVTNPNQDADKPKIPQKAVISLKNHHSTSYETYLMVHNELKAVYNQLWHTCAEQQFGKTYEELSIKDRHKIKAKYPYKISEAEPE